MTLRVRITPEAQADLADGREWYEAASPGLGDAFIEEVESSIRAAADWPKAAALVDDEIRRALVARFPYGVYYVIEEETLVVLGCVHVRRHPRVWMSRRST